MYAPCLNSSIHHPLTSSASSSGPRPSPAPSVLSRIMLLPHLGHLEMSCQSPECHCFSNKGADLFPWSLASAVHTAPQRTHCSASLMARAPRVTASSTPLVSAISMEWPASDMVYSLSLASLLTVLNTDHRPEGYWTLYRLAQIYGDCHFEPIFFILKGNR